MHTTAPRFAELNAEANWRTVDFISDLHLQDSEPATVRLWESYLARTRADAVVILGDLFEVWIGDDSALSADADAGFEHHCAAVLRSACARRPVYFMHGNRDFLVGPAFADSVGLRLLQDPAILDFGAQRWLLSHGDALCLDDTEYQQFRAQVRQPGWQQLFLSRPLEERRAIARDLRQQSEARKRGGAEYADVDETLARQWLHACGARQMIHGHTHKPADHTLGDGMVRHVLSDWDAAAIPPRAEVLRLTRSTGSATVRVDRLAPADAL